MNITDSLINSGLDKKEARVYLATLELGESTVLPIAKKSGVGRTYCYDLLASLGQKGLVSFVEKNGRRRYSAASPKTFKTNLSSRLKELEQVLPDLEILYKGAAEKPRIQYFEGMEGVKQLYEDVLHETKEVWFFGSVGDFADNYPEYKEYLDKLIKAKVKVRDLVKRDKTAVDLYSSYKEPEQEMRFLPKNMSFATDNMIWNNKVIMVSYGQSIHAVSIESEEITKTFRAIHEALWASAEKS